MTVPFAIGDELLAAALNGLKMNFTVQVFTASGTWIKPAGLARLYVRVVGAGGGSGGSAATTASQCAAAAGGGGGGYSEKLFLASALSNTETVTIGAGGAAGASGANAGGTGGTTLFADGKAYVVQATGGTGGGGGVATATLNCSTGGFGGSGSGGDINFKGGHGGAGEVVVGPSGANNGAYPANWGGKSHLSGQADVPTTNSNGTPGFLYGGGASGSFNGLSQSARGGSAGAAGLVVVWNCF